MVGPWATDFCWKATVRRALCYYRRPQGSRNADRWRRPDGACQTITGFWILIKARLNVDLEVTGQRNQCLRLWIQLRSSGLP